MALCKVIKTTEGWNIGDHVEAFEHRLKELVDQGIVEVLVPDEKIEVALVDEVNEAPVAKKTRKKKGV